MGTDSSIKELSAQEKKTGEAGCLAKKKKISKQLHRFSFILFFLDFLRG
jgi:hypothetical protein